MSQSSISRAVPDSPADLLSARNAVVKLVNCLNEAIKTFRGPTNALPVIRTSGRKILKVKGDELDRLLKDAEAKHGTVLHELEIVCQERDQESIAKAIIEFTKNFRNEAHRLYLSSSSFTEDSIQRWLSSSIFQVQQWLVGINQSLVNIKISSGLDHEFQKASRIRSKRKFEQTRMKCDSSDRSFWLDGKRLASGLNQEEYDYLALLVEMYPEPITYSKIKTKLKTHPENQTRFNTKINKLPETFNSKIEVKRTQGRGHVLAILERE